MLCKILKEFPYSVDGVTSKTLTEGLGGIEILDGLVHGLIAEGYVALDGEGHPVEGGADNSPVGLPLTAPEEDISALGHAALGEMLSARGLTADEVKALNSKEARRAKLKELATASA